MIQRFFFYFLEHQSKREIHRWGQRKAVPSHTITKNIRSQQTGPDFGTLLGELWLWRLEEVESDRCSSNLWSWKYLWRGRGGCPTSRWSPRNRIEIYTCWTQAILFIYYRGQFHLILSRHLLKIQKHKIPASQWNLLMHICQVSTQ